MVQECII